MAQRKQYRRWAFTINNYTDEEVASVKALVPSVCNYIAFSKEVGQVTGTPHLQGYFEFQKKVTLSGLKKLMPRGHFEPARGDCFANIKYVAKSGVDVYKDGESIEEAQERRGAARGQAVKDEWREISDLLKSGQGDVVEAKFPSHWRIHRLANQVEYPCPAVGSGPNYWLYGESGSGKTTFAEMFAAAKGWKAYHKLPSKWWDGYTNEELVYMDDIDPTHDDLLFHIKMMGDFRPFNAEIKGGQRKIRPQVVVITSNSHPSQIFPKASREDMDAIYRRFRVLHFQTRVEVDFGLKPTEVPAEVQKLLKLQGHEAVEERSLSVVLPACRISLPPSMQKACVGECSEGAECLESVLAKDGEDKEDAEGGESSSRKRVRQE